MTAERDNPRVPCVAGVLIGGRSERMGCPKALLPLRAGRTLVEHVVGVARAVADEVVLLGQLAPPASLGGMTSLADYVAGGGPLAGLAALLQHAPDSWALLLACDMPRLARPVLERLCAQPRTDADAVASWKDQSQRVYHACCALYHPRVLPQVVEELNEGKGSVQHLLRRIRVVGLTPTAAESRQLTNVNTPQELAAALADMECDS